MNLAAILSPCTSSAYECLIIACPTWNIGEVQSDQEGFFPNLMILILAAKKQLIWELATKHATRINLQMQWGLGLKYREGGETVGYWSVDGQDFNESQAVVDGKLLGLAIDEDNQSDLTEARIKSWVSQLKKEFSLQT